MGSSSPTRYRTLGPLHWEVGVLVTGSPGKSQCGFYKDYSTVAILSLNMISILNLLQEKRKINVLFNQWKVISYWRIIILIFRTEKSNFFFCLLYETILHSAIDNVICRIRSSHRKGSVLSTILARHYTGRCGKCHRNQQGALSIKLGPEQWAQVRFPLPRVQIAHLL